MYTCFCVWEEGNVRRRTRQRARAHAIMRRRRNDPVGGGSLRPSRVVVNTRDNVTAVITAIPLTARKPRKRAIVGDETAREFIRCRWSETYASYKTSGDQTFRLFTARPFHENRTPRLYKNALPPTKRILAMCAEKQRILVDRKTFLPLLVG